MSVLVMYYGFKKTTGKQNKHVKSLILQISFAVENGTNFI